MRRTCVFIVILLLACYAFASMRTCEGPSGCEGDLGGGSGTTEPTPVNDTPGGNSVVTTLSTDDEEQVLAMNDNADTFAVPRDLEDAGIISPIIAIGNIAYKDKCFTDCTWFEDDRFKQPYCSDCKKLIAYVPPKVDGVSKCYDLPEDIKSGKVSLEFVNQALGLCRTVCKTCVNKNSLQFTKENVQFMNLLVEKVRDAAAVLFQNLSQKFQSAGSIIQTVSNTIKGVIDSRSQQFNQDCAQDVLKTLNEKVEDVTRKIIKAQTEATSELEQITKKIKDAKGKGEAERASDDGLKTLKRIYHDASRAFDDLMSFLQQNKVAACVKKVNTALKLVSKQRYSGRRSSRSNRRSNKKNNKLKSFKSGKNFKNKGPRGNKGGFKPFKNNRAAGAGKGVNKSENKGGKRNAVIAPKRK